MVRMSPGNYWDGLRPVDEREALSVGTRRTTQGCGGHMGACRGEDNMMMAVQHTANGGLRDSGCGCGCCEVGQPFHGDTDMACGRLGDDGALLLDARGAVVVMAGVLVVVGVVGGTVFHDSAQHITVMVMCHKRSGKQHEGCQRQHGYVCLPLHCRFLILTAKLRGFVCNPVAKTYKMSHKRIKTGRIDPRLAK